jgi:hypothetical protein
VKNVKRASPFEIPPHGASSAWEHPSLAVSARSAKSDRAPRPKI